jgi:protoporphyrinogen oxidase
LVCAAELLEKGQFTTVTILEKDPCYVGGIARTVEYKGFRFDIGGHRFFSKSQEITDWWKKRLPSDFIQVGRLSRIFYRGVFFDYPLKAMNALFGLGIGTSTLCVLSYIKSRISPITPEKSFQDWVSNRFGRKLFGIFFKTYTEKVWGTPCDQISADWAAQRIKGLSLFKAIYHALLPKGKKSGGGVKTLINQFEYPRLGPGQMWEKTRDDIVQAGGTIHMGEAAVKISREGNRVTSVTTRNEAGEERIVEGSEFIVTMPLRETILALDPPLPQPVLEAARRLGYRDFLTVALMVKRTSLFPDNWIYVHDPSVHLGRIQNFNNWSSALLPKQDVTCLGLEYFCFEGDELWTMPDDCLIELGKKEVVQLGLVQAGDVFDGRVVRMPKAYPVYGPDYQKDVDLIREQIGKLENLQVVGRNGMHKYNNMDHSMMASLIAARRLFGGTLDPWKVNTDAEYHEEEAEK